jgi:hypothetical protein
MVCVRVLRTAGGISLVVLGIAVFLWSLESFADATISRGIQQGNLSTLFNRPNINDTK